MKSPLHPGEFIKLGYLEPLGIQASELADRLDISQSTMSRILNKKIDISQEMAIRLSIVIGRTPQSWLNMQSAYCLDKAAPNVDVSRLRPFDHQWQA